MIFAIISMILIILIDINNENVSFLNSVLYSIANIFMCYFTVMSILILNQLILTIMLEV